MEEANESSNTGKGGGSPATAPDVIPWEAPLKEGANLIPDGVTRTEITRATFGSSVVMLALAALLCSTMWMQHHLLWTKRATEPNTNAIASDHYYRLIHDPLINDIYDAAVNEGWDFQSAESSSPFMERYARANPAHSVLLGNTHGSTAMQYPTLWAYLADVRSFDEPALEDDAIGALLSSKDIQSPITVAGFSEYLEQHYIQLIDEYVAAADYFSAERLATRAAGYLHRFDPDPALAQRSPRLARVLDQCLLLEALLERPIIFLEDPLGASKLYAAIRSVDTPDPLAIEQLRTSPSNGVRLWQRYLSAILLLRERRFNEADSALVTLSSEDPPPKLRDLIILLRARALFWRSRIELGSPHLSAPRQVLLLVEATKSLASIASTLQQRSFRTDIEYYSATLRSDEALAAAGQLPPLPPLPICDKQIHGLALC